MYKTKKRGWMTHFDFKALDVLVMLITYFSIFGSAEKFEMKSYISGALILVMFGLLLSIMTELHDNVLFRKVLPEFFISLFYIGVCETVTVLYLVYIQQNTVKASAVWLFILVGIGLDFLIKTSYKELVKQGLSSNNSKREFIVVASDDNIEQTIDRIREYSFGQVEIAGVVIIGESRYKVGDKINGYEFVSDIYGLPGYIQKKWLDEVLINLPNQRAPYDVLAKLTEMGIATHRVINFDLEKDNTKVVEKVAGYTCLTESIRIIQSTQFIAKRIIDIIGGLVGSVLTILLTVFIGPLIFITDPGPVFFSQKRIGKGGRVFNMIKFRSMYKDAEARKAELLDKNNISDGMMFKMDNDPRILGSGPDGTKKGIGWFLRKFSLDEFPQFFLVLKGDMSLVGTRPPTLDEWEKYDSAHRARMAIRPGITGMWQVSGRSDITDFEKVVEMDTEYIKNMSALFDIKLILKTVKNMFTGDGAK